MYYGNDNNGHIIFSGESSILPDQYDGLYPSDASDIPVSDFQRQSPFNESQEQSVSSGDALFLQTASANGSDGLVSYDDLIDLLASVPDYNVYPNTGAVSVFEKVLNGVDQNVGYFVISGSDTYSTYLYYSPDYSISGNTVTLFGDVTQCYYHQYRPSSSSSWQYTYTVAKVGETSFTLSDSLVYTNLFDGYPDLIPYKQKESYTMWYVLIGVAVFGFLSARMAVRRNYV